jgi:RHS repeat-associated protein
MQSTFTYDCTQNFPPPHVFSPSRFTGKERDNESGLDYFGARYYGSSMSRFMSPDPSGLSFADPENPQSLNLYSYVRNNPLTNTDPTGMECVWPSKFCSCPELGYTSCSSKCRSEQYPVEWRFQFFWNEPESGCPNDAECQLCCQPCGYVAQQDNQISSGNQHEIRRLNMFCPSKYHAR